MKYIFIDTNQYRHLFSKNEGFSDEIKTLLDKLINEEKIKLLLPQQVKEEVERNRFETWYVDELKGNTNKIEKLQVNIGSLEKMLGGFPRELGKVKRKLEKELSVLKREAISIKKRYRELKSKANQKLKTLFDEAEFIGETEEIVQKARLRLDKGNPPNDNKLGDALIWESLLCYLKDAPKKSTMVFVARDGDAWGKDGFNPWLERELKQQTGVSISLTNALSDINGLTNTEQKRLKEIERQELKNNAVSNFINSRSFMSAGAHCQSLLLYKDILTEEDYRKIVTASISNHEIYRSFFTSDPLNNLCLGGAGCVVNYLEAIDRGTWDSFVKMNDIKVKRQIDGSSDIDPEDIPF
jgi:hypothetical protein